MLAWFARVVAGLLVMGIGQTFLIIVRLDQWLDRRRGNKGE